MARGKSKRKAGPAGFIEHNLPDAAGMLTIEEGHAIWRDLRLAPRVAGSFVRLKPPAGTTAEQLASVKAGLLETCAAQAVKALPVPVEAVPDAPAEPTPDTELGIRQVVIARADRTNGVRDPDALNTLLNTMMDKAGI